MKTYRVALIGCGSISGNHINALKKCGQDICALCDIVKEKAEKKREEYGLTCAVYTDYLTMLEKEKPDAVHICTPHYLHAPMIMEALQRNINVLSEKPLCISREECSAIAQAVAHSRGWLGICLQNRYEYNNRKIKEYLADKTVTGGMGIVAWNRDEAYYRSADWRGKWATEGGGVLINQALHTLDLLQWMGGYPAEIKAHIFNLEKPYIEVEDTAVYEWTMEDGTTRQFYCTTDASSDFPAQIQLKVRDKEGKSHRIYVDNQIALIDGIPLPPPPKEDPVGKFVWGNGHTALIRDYYEKLTQNVPFPVDFEEGKKVMQLLFVPYDANERKPL